MYLQKSFTAVFFLSGFHDFHDSWDSRERGGYLIPHYHFYPLHKHLHSSVINAESSSLHMVSDQTRTRNL